MLGEGRRLLLWDFTSDSGAEMQNIEDVNKETMGEMYYFLTFCLFYLLSLWYFKKLWNSHISRSCPISVLYWTHVFFLFHSRKSVSVNRHGTTATEIDDWINLIKKTVKIETWGFCRTVLVNDLLIGLEMNPSSLVSLLTSSSDIVSVLDSLPRIKCGIHWVYHHLHVSEHQSCFP